MSQVASPVAIREPGLIADYFAAAPTNTTRGAVVVLGGSEGGRGVSRGLARALSADGFHAMAVSYFGEPGQPDRLELVPVEPVSRAGEWLDEYVGAKGTLGLIGVSKGGELALLVGSLDSRFKAVVAGVPSNLVWQGISSTPAEIRSSWTVAGRERTCAPFAAPDGFVSIFRLYEDGLVAAPEETEIEVEKIAGPILLVSATDDRLWPSAEMATRIERRLRAHDFRHSVLNLIYEDAGHAVFGVPVSSETPEMHERLAAVGGTCQGVTAARNDAWPRMVAFLTQALAPETPSSGQP